MIDLKFFMQWGYFNIMKKQAWNSQLIKTDAAEPVSPKEGAQQRFTTQWGGYTLLWTHPSRGNRGSTITAFA